MRVGNSYNRVKCELLRSLRQAYRLGEESEERTLDIPVSRCIKELGNSALYHQPAFQNFGESLQKCTSVH